jgi:hypothetical protein
VSDIILRPIPHAAEGDIERIRFSIVLEDANWVGLYDRIQVFRSVTGASGPFDELTATSWTRPRLPKDGGDLPASPVTGALVAIVGKTLDVIINGQTTSITFTGSDPLTLSQVATQIMAQSLSRLASYVDAGGGLVIEDLYPGLLSTLVIPPSDGATILGLPSTEPDNTAQGKDPRPALVTGVETYPFEDPYGSRKYFYRTRLINQTSGEASDSSISFSADDDIGVGPSNTIIGYVDLAELTGVAARNMQVSVHNDFSGDLVGGKLVVGASETKLTDESGRAEFVLVRGQRLTVSVQNTSLARSITVPTDPALALFSLFDPTIGEVDVFRAAVPNVVTAERRTL